jgi:hypothetical protein
MKEDELEAAYRDTVSKMEAVQQQLGAMTRDDPAREALKSELEAHVARTRALKEKIKHEGMKRNFAGLTSPLFEACVARLEPAVVAELETDALARQAERDQRGVERRAAKVAATPPASPPTPPPPTAPTLPPHARGTLRHGVKMPEVYRTIARPTPPTPQSPPPAAPLPPTSAPRSSGGLRAEVADTFRAASRR